MKRFLLAGAAIVALGAGGAWAQDFQSESFTLQGTQDDVCTLGTFAHGDTASGSTFDGTTLTLTLSDSTALLPSFGVTLTADAMCNFDSLPVAISSANTGMTIDTAVASVGEFIDTIHYTADVDWHTSADILGIDTSTEDEDSDSDLINAHNGDLVIVISSIGSQVGTPVLAGSYSDTLTIEIGTEPVDP